MTKKEQMVKTVRVVLFLMSIGAVCAQSQTSQRMHIKTVIGKAELRSVGGKWRPARAEMPIREGWDIRTYVESSLEIQFSTGTVIRIGEKSAFNVSQALQDGDVTKSHVKVHTGKVWGNVQKLVGKGSSFEFETPTAVASIRGTRLGISVDKQSTAIDVYEGAVSVRKKGESKAVLVKTKKRAVVEKNQNVVSVMSFEEVVKSEKKIDVSDPFINENDIKPDSSSTDSKGNGQEAPSDSVDNEIQEETNKSENESEIESENTTIDDDTSDSESNLETQKRLYLSLKTPSEGQTLKKPLIELSGITTPGASIQIDNEDVRVGTGGVFMHQIHIPDEKGEITFDIVAQLNGKEVSVSRAVTYEPDRQPLTLSIQSPEDGMKWDKNAVAVVGKTNPTATVFVNGRPAAVTPNGVFHSTIRLTERDLEKEFTIEIQARDEYDQIDESVSIIADGESRQLNTSYPQISVSGITRNATRNGQLTLQVTDRTPGDRIRVIVDNDGSVDEYTLEPNGYEKFRLEEGKNTYSVKAFDLAANRSNIIQGEVYYLPGPLDIYIKEPFENPLLIDDLPPMPRGVGAMKKDVEVEIDDGIGSVPETIQYVKIKGANQELLLDNVYRYTYRGSVTLMRGRNVYTVIAEDLAGNRATQQILITVAD